MNSDGNRHTTKPRPWCDDFSIKPMHQIERESITPPSTPIYNDTSHNRATVVEQYELLLSLCAVPWMCWVIYIEKKHIRERKRRNELRDVRI